MTSSAAPGDADAAHQAGIDAFLPKPVRISQLYDCLASLLSPSYGDKPAPMITEYTLPEAVAGTRAGRVLVVDDNPVNQRVVVRMLEKMGHGVDVADTGVAAVASVARARYDAVLMDCQMPVMDRFEATREIRRQQAGTDRHTPIIALTAGAMMGDEGKCLEAGMDAYLSKPIKADSLAMMVERWTELRARSRPEHVRPLDAGVLDTSCIAGQRDLGVEEFVKLVHLFMNDGAARVAALHSAEKDHDVSAIVKLAHSLKGSAATFGDHTLAQRCSELQVLASAGDFAESTRLIDSVDAGFVVASEALREELLTF
jgi:CheY-like chemotaxis protein/HPt (histidine-containing phosphotransfer) domain-containing protein